MTDNRYEALVIQALRKDFAYILTKLNGDGQEIPGWTGLNIRLLGEIKLKKLVIHYLPGIKASPTAMSMVNTIIQESLTLGARLQLEHIVLVFKQAIYAKVQESRWTNEGLKKWLVVCLGKFHTCM